MHAVRWLLVACVVTLFIVDSRSSPTCEIPPGHKEGEIVRAPHEPKAGQMICQKRVVVEIVSRRCKTRYCCEPECTCLGETHMNSSACSSTFTELSCFVEHKDVRSYKIECCNGFTLNSDGMCIDINECDSSPCEQRCHNYGGGFDCHCFHGYQLSSDGHTCLEDPTCGNKCAHECTKVRGMYRCRCRSNYFLGEDGTTCHPLTNCSAGNDCEHVCKDTATGIECSCRSGYRLNYNGSSCDDVNECSEKKLICDHECVNTIGSYRCVCDFGFRLNVTDGRSCIADPTCGERCDHACAWVHGRYRCLCREGFELADDHVTCRSTDVITSNSPQTSNDVTTSARPSVVIITKASTSTSSKTKPIPMIAVYIFLHAVLCISRH